MPLAPYDLTGIVALRAFSAHDPPPDKAPVSEDLSDPLPGIDELIAELAQTGPGITMIMGKGGVGKTSIAAAVARGLARAGCATHLASTDPAGHPADDTDGSLTTSWIDPAGETQRYIDAKLDRAKHLDQAARDLLVEDLRSPCTEELAVFIAFSNLIRRGRTEHVVIDTAPTGHTLLLLDQTGSYHHDVMRTSTGVEGRVTTPLMRLQDPGYTRILIVTLAQTTPVQEATELQTDLRRRASNPTAGSSTRASPQATHATPYYADGPRSNTTRYATYTTNSHEWPGSSPGKSIHPVTDDVRAWTWPH